MPMVLLLGRIEVRRNVSIVTPEDCKHLLAILNESVRVVRQRDMPYEGVLRALKQWKVIGDEALRCMCDHTGKRCIAHHCRDRVWPDFMEMTRNIHS